MVCALRQISLGRTNVCRCDIRYVMKEKYAWRMKNAYEYLVDRLVMKKSRGRSACRMAGDVLKRFLSNWLGLNENIFFCGSIK
jgi:hypothetical protein